ncbi:dual specificity protein phosphatase 15 isoform X2 [Phlebotomus papatasi]|uniref:dual specificity protein phosphatase 15 isoform X2 n=1 Tax=Phlebotomus papatasi TaxID=29031 RepID=UPI002483C8B7|nr:dual specificity protein phosphatase 15 isoform X2 [Phlebotomus papatasi]XP_055706126.1 dual specificity protein phosphatase 15 isoform X2 [Phlebotomus papatasi]
MGNGMNKVLPGLYVGNYRDSKDPQQLDKHNITHILAIHDSPRRLHPDKHYLCVMAADTPDQNLAQYFSVCNDFIHAARLREGNVLIHCLAGMSRSVTVAVAYIMSVTPLTWREALKVVRAGRAVANPNLGFQNQLQEFESAKLSEERKRLKERFPSLALELTDRQQCNDALNNYEELLSNKDICEGHCVRGEVCPTGMCNSATGKGIFRRKSSTSSTSSRSKLAPPGTAQSCPTSPRRSHRVSRDPVLHDLPGTSETDVDVQPSTSLHRSASTVSSLRPRSSPAGLYSYTGSAPTSVHGSRVDLSNVGTGSAIYVGCAPNSRGSVTSVPRLQSSSRSGSQLSIISVSTPPSTPKRSQKR